MHNPDDHCTYALFGCSRLTHSAHTTHRVSQKKGADILATDCASQKEVAKALLTHRVGQEHVSDAPTSCESRKTPGKPVQRKQGGQRATEDGSCIARQSCPMIHRVTVCHGVCRRANSNVHCNLEGRLSAFARKVLPPEDINSIPRAGKVALYRAFLTFFTTRGGRRQGDFIKYHYTSELCTSCGCGNVHCCM